MLPLGFTRSIGTQELHMSRDLVFVHGRADQSLDAAGLKQAWIDAWRTGLSRSGLDLPLTEDRIQFPFFGDVLEQMAGGRSADDAARAIVRGDHLTRDQELFLKAFLAEVQECAGISDQDVAAILEEEVRERGVLDWGWVQGILAVLDQRVAVAGGASIALHANDLYHYLNDSERRRNMGERLRAALRPGVETVVVAHSLGSVVAYDLLKREEDLNVPLFVTLGSPLSVSMIKRSLRPLVHPGCVGHWFNAVDDDDLVALFPLDPDNFNVEPPVENKTDIDHPGADRHGVAGYLGDPEVARRIRDAVLGA
jgi:hypothetical protein